MSAPRGLHHNAYRCRDSEQTRRFYEDFLGMRLACTLQIDETMTGRKTSTLRTFYELGDGSYLAFFEAPDMPFEFKHQHDYDLHIALEVAQDDLLSSLQKAKSKGIESRGVSNHGFIHSVYFRDPNGYVIELTAKQASHAQATDPAQNGARAKLDRWQASKEEWKSRATTTRP